MSSTTPSTTAATVSRPGRAATRTTAAGRLRSLARAELTLLGRSKGTMFAAMFVPLVMPFSVRQAADGMDLDGTGLSIGSVVLPSAIGFSLLFAVYSALVSVYAARREELVLKRLRTGEVRDIEILAGSAVPSVAVGFAQCLILTGACVALLDVGAPDAPLHAVLGLLLAFALWPVLAAVTATFSRSVESAQVAAMPLLLVSFIGSGTLVPLEVMPDKLAAVCELLPLTPTIELIRGGWTGDMSASDALGAVVIAVAWIGVGVFAVRRWFRWEPRR
ncbi:ABC transporter permease [Streptomyces flavofungini]|uniref:Transport permease protein n=1 Tax=Streptomyces flavofungini TaxID=68200 RepID=A0ABS0XHD1_9ACTN|nr:ABC transporter permease [Streptomyces flavofungini]MBJ3812622.1 ABC transporter permease [Streptomyces flavofungini]GHC87604.1 transport permease protein [Streptomyces flavofungini]